MPKHLYLLALVCVCSAALSACGNKPLQLEQAPGIETTITTDE